MSIALLDPADQPLLDPDNNPLFEPVNAPVLSGGHRNVVGSDLYLLSVALSSQVDVTTTVLPSIPLLVDSVVDVQTVLAAQEQRLRVGSTVVVTTYGQFFVPTTYRASPSSIPIGARGIEGTQIVTSIGDYLVDESGNILIWGG